MATFRSSDIDSNHDAFKQKLQTIQSQNVAREQRKEAVIKAFKDRMTSFFGGDQNRPTPQAVSQFVERNTSSKSTPEIGLLSPTPTPVNDYINRKRNEAKAYAYTPSRDMKRSLSNLER